MPHTIRTWSLAALILGAAPRLAGACDCGPDFCTDDKRIATMLAAKKKSLAHQYPSRLIALLDRGPQCVARVEREPDGFRLLLVQSDGSMQDIPWSQGDEDLARKKLGTRDLRRYWVLNARRAFSCCGEPSYEKMNDYDASDDVNASRAIECKSGSPC